MKRLFSLFVFAVLAVSICHAQVGPTDGKTQYDWPKASTTGQLGSYLDLSRVPSINYTIDWAQTGTAPSACTFRIEGSSDGTNWTGLDATSPAVDNLPCTSTNMIHFVNKPTRYLRVNLVTYTPGDGTTSVVFHWTGAWQ